jgi:hypothetical protein
VAGKLGVIGAIEFSRGRIVRQRPLARAWAQMEKQIPVSGIALDEYRQRIAGAIHAVIRAPWPSDETKIAASIVLDKDQAVLVRVSLELSLALGANLFAQRN